MGKNQTHKSMQMAKHASRGGGGGPEDVDPRYAGRCLLLDVKDATSVQMQPVQGGPAVPLLRLPLHVPACFLWVVETGLASPHLPPNLQATTPPSTRRSGTRRGWRR